MKTTPVGLLVSVAREASVASEATELELYLTNLKFLFIVERNIVGL